jgi:RNA polymerase sigma-70 factor (ECF subfamily)
MSDDSLDTMLEKLSQGESAAAEQLFRNFEPFLRAMVRRRLSPPLRSKFDSVDVVQSVWAEVLIGFRERQWEFKDQAALKSFLARVTYNKFVTECRRNSSALEREQSLPPTAADEVALSSQPRPSEVVQADELWDTLMKLCPPAHRQILELKNQGLLISDIAARVGLHEGSVRRILYDLAKRLAAAQGDPSGRDGPDSESL